MPKLSEDQKATDRDDALYVPDKSDLLAILEQDCDPAGLPLEWLLDRRDDPERSA